VTAGSADLAKALASKVSGSVSRTNFGQSIVDVPVAEWRSAALIARDELGCTLFDWLGAEDAGRPGVSDRG
jgi:NADH-quinone oxidoreductase subunit C